MKTAPGWPLLLALALSASEMGSAASATQPYLENDSLRVDLSTQDASLTVVDKRIDLTWRQQIQPGFKVAPTSLHVTADSISCRVSGAGETCDLTIALKDGAAAAFDLTVAIPGERYATLPAYPFHFVAPGKGWSYVQNTSGEGMLMPLDRPGEINKPYGWSGSQPWWGLTDLQPGLAVRLDTFRNPDTSTGPNDSTVYALPMRLHFDFVSGGGYVALARLYREYFLATHPELTPLRERANRRPPVGMLKDGVYVYLWGDTPVDDLKLVSEMKAAGIDRGMAVFYGKRPVDRALFDGIKRLGWVPGLYHMPTGNLFRVGPHGWPNDVLTGRIQADQLRQTARPQSWDRICAKYQLPLWHEKAKALIDSYGTELFYFDTLVVQLAPCLSPRHPSTIEENQQARLELAQNTQELGTVVGSGEGLCPTWALPGLDFFEGLMSLRTYADSRLRIPAGGYETDLGNSYAADAAVLLDEKRRIPLYELAFHDYVAGTWVWRDTNFQSRPFAWKKDLFNILYGTMPMWHMNRRLWDSHKADYLASYRAIAPVRSRIGFAAMTGHGWLTPDRSVQYTDWDTGDRVIVNFGNKAYQRAGRPTVAAASFLLEQTDSK
ncbi:MAG: glycoside hydrolase [Chthoniobacterales bacterium]